jgi:hypothetical protein
VSILMGLAVLAAGVGLLWAFRAAPSQVVHRSEWIEVGVAITAVTAIGIGGIFVVAGVGSFFL